MDWIETLLVQDPGFCKMWFRIHYTATASTSATMLVYVVMVFIFTLDTRPAVQRRLLPHCTVIEITSRFFGWVFRIATADLSAECFYTDLSPLSFFAVHKKALVFRGMSLFSRRFVESLAKSLPFFILLLLTVYFNFVIASSCWCAGFFHNSSRPIFTSMTVSTF